MSNVAVLKRPVAAPQKPNDRERFLAFAFTAAEILAEVSPEGRITFATGAYESRLGSPADDWVGRPAQELVAAADRATFATAFALLLARGRLPPTAFRLADAAGSSIALSGLRVIGPSGIERVCLCVAAMPVAPPAAAPLAAGDALQQVAEARLRHGPPAKLGLIELAGPDGIISPRPEVARRIGETLASAATSDGVAGELSAGRYGLLSGPGQDLTALAGQIESVLRDSGINAAVTTRALDLQDGELSPLQATRALRYALNSFAQGGGAALSANGFGEGLSGFVASALARGTAIRRTIAEKRFKLAFQPIVSLADRKTHHFEALIRPQPTPGNPVAKAQELVTFAETVGLSEELDWAVVECACEAARSARGAQIACNLSGLSLQSADFRARLLALLDNEPDLIPNLLIEITETAEIEQETEAVATTEALRDRGLPLCIDDFGAGAAGFRYLRLFRVDYVKIDGLYVMNAMRSDQDRGFVSAMVDLARTVGAEVVAERIETEAEAKLMLELGVQYGQGWLFGKPGALPGTI